MDNMSNNDVMMAALVTKLKLHDISFDACNHRIMCFAHIIDLCSGWAICASSGVDKGVLPSNETASDPISVAHAAVRAIQGSGNIEGTLQLSSQMATRVAGSKWGSHLRQSNSSCCSSYKMYPHGGILFFTCSIDFMRCAWYVFTPPSRKVILAK